MEAILLNVMNNSFKIENINNKLKKDLFILLENNREDLFSYQLNMSLIDSFNEFENIINNSKNFSIILKNDKLIGCIFIKSWGVYDELSFWLDKDNRDNKIFTELCSIYLKSYNSEFNPNLLVLDVRNKAIVCKKITKKLGFKNAFRYNSKIVEFDNKKVLATSMFYKIYNDEYGFPLTLFELNSTLENDLTIFCKDLLDYTFKRNDFFVEIQNEYYYWSGLDVTDEMKEVYFINISKAKSSYKKILKRISIVDEYKEYYQSCKTFYIIFHRNLNRISLMFLIDKKSKWLHFDNSIF